jgi:hypothetical protein
MEKPNTSLVTQQNRLMHSEVSELRMIIHASNHVMQFFNLFDERISGGNHAYVTS